MFKKLSALIVVSCFLASFAASQSFGASIGFIDVQKVFKEYKETAKAQKDLSKQEEAFKKEFDDSQKKLKEAEDKGKTKEDLEKMKKDLEEKLSPKRTELLKMNEQMTMKLQKAIVTSVQKVSEKVGIDVVVDKQVVIVGGMDLTDLVITELNK